MTKISEMTVDELRKLIQDTVEPLLAKYNVISNLNNTSYYYEQNPNSDWLHKVWCSTEGQIDG